MSEKPLRQKKINAPKVQNEIPDYGAAREVEPRCRSFGVLGFPDSPEARWGGEPIHKVSEEEAERKSGEDFNG